VAVVSRNALFRPIQRLACENLWKNHECTIHRYPHKPHNPNQSIYLQCWLDRSNPLKTLGKYLRLGGPFGSIVRECACIVQLAVETNHSAR